MIRKVLSGNCRFHTKSALNTRATGGITVKSVRRVIRYYEHYGHVERPVRRPPRMCEKHSEIMVDFISENPWLYLDEVSSHLYSIAVVEVTIKRMRRRPRSLTCLIFFCFCDMRALNEQKESFYGYI